MKKITAAFFILLATAYPQNPLFIPDTLSGSVINLNLQHGSVNFFPNQATSTMGANGNILGPTLFLNRNSDVTINVNNQLMDTTTIHWHGLHVSPQNDGGPHIFIEPGEVWSPAFTVLDRASTYWYHPHMHHHTNQHVSKGISGFIIVRDEQEAAIDIPRKYGIDDFPLVVQTKSFDAGYQIIHDNPLDTTVMVNATVNPYLNAPAQVVRLRLLNGSSERAFNFGFSNNLMFYQISSDGGLLSYPVQLTRLLLSPGERAEILVNLSSLLGESFQLINYGSEIPSGIYGAAQPGIGPGQIIPGYNLNNLNGNNFSLLSINVLPPTPNPVTSIPVNLIAHNQWSVNQADTIRSFIFTSENAGPAAIQGPFRINGAFFNMNVINEYVPFNNIEVWEIRNQTPIAHPFHIHNVQFYIVDINGAPPPPNLAGRKDVILVRGGNNVVRFITKFENFHDDDFPYMYHCHLLTHEDAGMMGQFIVQSPPVPVELISFNAAVKKNYVQLDWATATETNNKGFEIERKEHSAEGPAGGINSAWKKITFIPGSGTTTEPQRYSFVDENVVSGKYKYRLTQIDYNGARTEEKEIEVEVIFPDEFSLYQNFPNPFNPSTKIKFYLPKESKINLSLYNIVGEKAAAVADEIFSAGFNEIDFTPDGLSAGIYFVRLISEDYNAAIKLVYLK